MRGLLLRSVENTPKLTPASVSAIFIFSRYMSHGYTKKAASPIMASQPIQIPKNNPLLLVPHAPASIYHLFHPSLALGFLLEPSLKGYGLGRGAQSVVGGVMWGWGMCMWAGGVCLPNH